MPAGHDISSGYPVWAAYTPTWGATGSAPALGNGTLTGRYVQIGKLVVATLSWTAGSTTTYGTGTWTFTFPVTAASVSGGGTAQGNDVGTALYSLLCVPYTTTTFTLQSSASPAAGVGPTVPFTWGSTDTITALVTYEAA